jgi:hypothetical protein
VISPVVPLHPPNAGNPEKCSQKRPVLVCVSNLSLLGLQPTFLILKKYKIRKEAKKVAYEITLPSVCATLAPENGARSDLSVCLYVYSSIVAR